MAGTRKFVECEKKSGKDDPDCGLSHFRASALHLTLFLRCFGVFKPTQACTRLRCLEIMCVYMLHLYEKQLK